jgi:hypothetical protein
MIALVDSFPLQLGGAVLEIAEPDSNPHCAKPGECWATVRLIRFDSDGSISDIVEQPVCIARASAMLDNHERVRNCVAAHGELLCELFEHNRECALTLMPHNLLFIHELLALERAFTVDDFVRALLAKKRLGSLISRG